MFLVDITIRCNFSEEKKSEMTLTSRSCLEMTLAIFGGVFLFLQIAKYDFLSALQSFFLMVVLALVYKCLLRNLLFPSKSKAKGIMRLAERGDLETLRIELTKKDATVHKRDENNWTLLHWAVISGQTDTAEFL